MNQLLCTLRYFATGSQLTACGDVIGAHESTACRIVHRITHAIASLYSEFIIMPVTVTEQNEVAAKFYNIAKFPRVIGAIDCTHIKILSPGIPMFHKNISYSCVHWVLLAYHIFMCKQVVIMQKYIEIGRATFLLIPNAYAPPIYCFKMLWLVGMVQYMMPIFGITVLRKETLYKYLFSILCIMMCLKMDAICFIYKLIHKREYFFKPLSKMFQGVYNDKLLVGDSGYAQTSYMMTPLPESAPSTRGEKLYQESQIRTRNVVERAFGVWKRRFPILSKGINVKLRRVPGKQKCRIDLVNNNI